MSWLSIIRLRRTRSLRNVILLGLSWCSVWIIWNSLPNTSVDEVNINQVIYESIGTGLVSVKLLPNVSTILVQPDPEYCMVRIYDYL